jgi:hypothetical protein
LIFDECLDVIVLLTWLVCPPLTHLSWLSQYLSMMSSLPSVTHQIDTPMTLLTELVECAVSDHCFAGIGCEYLAVTGGAEDAHDAVVLLRSAIIEAHTTGHFDDSLDAEVAAVCRALKYSLVLKVPPPSPHIHASTWRGVDDH